MQFALDTFASGIQHADLVRRLNRTFRVAEGFFRGFERDEESAFVFRYGVNMGGNTITGLPLTPTLDSEAVSKAYLDASTSSLILEDISDVTFTGLADGDILRRVSGQWVNVVPSTQLDDFVPDRSLGQKKVLAGMWVPEIVGALPVLPDANYPSGAVVVLTTDNKLYRTDGSTWTAAVPAADISGEIVGTQISNLAISTPKLAANAVTAAKVYSGAVEADKIQAGNIAVGAIGADHIQAGAIDVSKLAVVSAVTIRAALAPTTRPDGSALEDGDVWIDTDDGDAPYTWDTAPVTPLWVRTYTRIDGGNIVTGTIDANRIAAVNLSAIQANVSSLSAITADLGIITSGWMGNDAPGAAGLTAAIRLSGTTALPATNYIDFTATTTAPFIKHDGLTLLADGTATFSGDLSGVTGTFTTLTSIGPGPRVSVISSLVGAGDTEINASEIWFYSGDSGLATNTVQGKIISEYTGKSMAFHAAGSPPDVNLRLLNAGGADAFGQWDFKTTPTVNGTALGTAVNSVKDPAAANQVYASTAAGAGNHGWVNQIAASALPGVALRSDAAAIMSAYTSRIRFRSNTDIATINGSQASLEVYQDTAGTDAFMAFHISGDFAAYFGLDGTINDFVVGGWSMGAVANRVWHAGNFDPTTKANLSGATFSGAITSEAASAYRAIKAKSGGYYADLFANSNSALGGLLTGGSMAFYVAGGNVEAIRISSTGNLGIGTSDIEAWHTSYHVLDWGGAAIMNQEAASHYVQGAWHNGTSWLYRANSTAATLYRQYVGGHDFYVAPASSTTEIDTVITWTTALSLANSGAATFGGHIFASTTGLNIGTTTTRFNNLYAVNINATGTVTFLSTHFSGDRSNFKFTGAPYPGFVLESNGTYGRTWDVFVHGGVAGGPIAFYDRTGSGYRMYLHSGKLEVLGALTVTSSSAIEWSGSGGTRLVGSDTVLRTYVNGTEMWQVDKTTQYWYANGAWRMYLHSTALSPYTNAGIDLGQSDRQWRNMYIGGVFIAATSFDVNASYKHLGLGASNIMADATGSMWLAGNARYNGAGAWVRNTPGYALMCNVDPSNGFRFYAGDYNATAGTGVSFTERFRADHQGAQVFGRLAVSDTLAVTSWASVGGNLEVGGSVAYYNGYSNAPFRGVVAQAAGGTIPAMRDGTLFLEY